MSFVAWVASYMLLGSLLAGVPFTKAQENEVVVEISCGACVWTISITGVLSRREDEKNQPCEFAYCSSTFISGSIDGTQFHDLIKEIDEYAFGPLVDGYSLRMHLPGVDEMPENFLSGASSLTDLELWHANQIKKLPSDFLSSTYVPGLQFLKMIEWSLLEEIPTGFLSNMPSLSSVLLQSVRETTTVPSNFLKGTTSINDLTLNNWPELSELPAKFLDDASLHLTNLGIYSNAKLEGLPVGFLNVAPKMRKLDLGENGLTSLPEGFLQFALALTELQLQNNQISELPAGCLEHSDLLRRMYIYSNPLTGLPSGFLEDTPNLYELNLSLNDLTGLPTGALQFTPTLRNLFLNDNVLTGLPSGALGYSPDLRDVRLQNNALTGLPSGFLANSPELEVMYVHNNNITYLEAGFYDNKPGLSCPYSSLPCHTNGFDEEVCCLEPGCVTPGEEAPTGQTIPDTCGLLAIPPSPPPQPPPHVPPPPPQKQVCLTLPVPQDGSGCCEELPMFQYNHPDDSVEVCGSSLTPHCMNGDWPTAYRMCDLNSARLCYLEDLAATQSTGCMSNSTKSYMWTQEPCTVAGEAGFLRANAMNPQDNFCAMTDNTFAVSCCADACT